MSNVAKEKVKIYEALLSSPGMGDKCKVGLHLSRQSILVLTKIIEAGLKMSKESPDNMVNLLPQESLTELNEVVPDILQKAGLVEFNEKLKQL